MLQQGIGHRPPPMAASKELPPAKTLQQPATDETPVASTLLPATQLPLPSLASGLPHTVPEVAAPTFVFILPQDTSGTALTKRRFDQPVGPSGQPEPKTTAWYHRKKQEEEQRLGLKRRHYTRCADIKCRQCGQIRKDGKHRQLYSNWYCPSTAAVSYEEWEAPLKEKYRKLRQEKN